MQEVNVYKITEMRDGSVYRTKLVKSLWITCEERTREEENVIAQQNGGDFLVCTGKVKF